MGRKDAKSLATLNKYRGTDIFTPYFGVMESAVDTLQAMRVVIAIAEHGSLTTAARHLDTSLPTVVRVLAATEQHLGVRLFERTTRQVRITEEGRLYLETSRSVLREIDAVEDVLRDRESEPSGHLVVCAPVLFGQYHVAPVLNAFMARYPHVNVTLTLLDRITDLVEEGIDVALRIGPVVAPDLVVTPIGHVRRCLCASPAFLASVPPINEPDDIKSLPFLQHRVLLPSTQVQLQDDGTPFTLKMNNVRMKTNTAGAVISACLDDLGLGMLLSYQIDELVAAGKLQLVLERYLPPPIPVSLVYLPSRRASVRTRTFINWAREKITERLPQLIY